MYFICSLLVVTMAIASTVHSFPSSVLESSLHSHSLSRTLHDSMQTLKARDVCSGNTPTTRSQWCDYSIETDYYTEAPDTGVTREYWLELTETTLAPDGVPRYVMTINGSVPGPTIFADWGDTVVVHLTNSLASSTNGTSLHFHGIRQNYTNEQDGVASITQCPTAPGHSNTYTWRATQYGSTWYHSHFSLQAWEGVFGGIVINGPATANYDEDLGIVFLNDWDHQTVDELWTIAQSGPPTLANGLINGTNTYEDGGSRLQLAFTENKSYRLRLVNGAIDTHFKFMIDNHTMEVIASDLVPITPYETNILDIGMGQRYDIIVKANAASIGSDFWLRALPQSACSDISNAGDIKGIIHYGSSTSEPTTAAYEYDDICADETENIVPYVAKSASSGDVAINEQASARLNENNLFRWYLNDTTMIVDWQEPTLLQVINGNTTWEKSNAVIHVPEANKWVYIAIQTTLGVAHPIHLHGHDFFVLAQGTGAYDSATTSLELINPPRRDTAMLPASGYLVLAFESDNPGAWLMHCHIAWHTSEGFALQIVERYDEIEAITDTAHLRDSCSIWSEHQKSVMLEQDDSGI